MACRRSLDKGPTDPRRPYLARYMEAATGLVGQALTSLQRMPERAQDQTLAALAALAAPRTSRSASGSPIRSLPVGPVALPQIV